MIKPKLKLDDISKASNILFEFFSLFKKRLEGDFKIKITQIKVSSERSLIHPVEYVNSNIEGLFSYVTIRYEAFDVKSHNEFLDFLSNLELLNDPSVITYYNSTYHYYFEDSISESILEVVFNSSEY